MGTGIGKGMGGDDFNADKLRYHRIIMTDADVDGAQYPHAAADLPVPQMPELVERGHAPTRSRRCAMKHGKQEQYLKTAAS